MKFNNERLRLNLDNVVVYYIPNNENGSDTVLLMLTEGEVNYPGWRGIDLATGRTKGNDDCSLAECAGVEWVINPGDICLFLTNHNIWKEAVYGGFSGKPNFPFKSSEGFSYREIRPLSKDPKESKLLKTIEQTKESLSVLEKELKEYKEKK